MFKAARLKTFFNVIQSFEKISVRVLITFDRFRQVSTGFDLFNCFPPPPLSPQFILYIEIVIYIENYSV